jgi:hypothetical protein
VKFLLSVFAWLVEKLWTTPVEKKGHHWTISFYLALLASLSFWGAVWDAHELRWLGVGWVLCVLYHRWADTRKSPRRKGSHF